MVIGVIGGSGLYNLGQQTGEFIEVNTPYGVPSTRVYRDCSKKNEVLFLSRHGEHHSILPSEINYRANIFALKKLGARAVVSISAVGSLREEISPGDFVLPSQYIDRTTGSRPGTFFGRGIVAHAHFANPACTSLRNHLGIIAERQGIQTHNGGTYICIEGPQFSTRAESHWFRSWNGPSQKVSIIGMTALPEARLAREAGLCYQTVAMATDYDCWNERTGDVSVDAILTVLKKNIDRSRQIISTLLDTEIPPCKEGCSDSMKSSFITAREHWPANRCEEIDLLLS